MPVSSNGKNLVPLKFSDATESYYFFQEGGKQLETKHNFLAAWQLTINSRPKRSATFILKMAQT